MKEIKEFQTESKQLLNLMINSIYTNKEIFLRELISNASDAIDKRKFITLTSEGKYQPVDYEIELSYDEKERSLTIKDNGIGMSKDDLVNNLGTIAKSGSKDFLSKFKEIKDNKDLNIIGQFGVGFYSAFMVAKKIEVKTKTFDDNGYLFISDGVETYSIEEIEKDELGTEIKIYLKDNEEDYNYDKFLSDYEIEDLVKKYSDYIRYPIKMNITSKKAKLDNEGKEIENEYEDVIEEKTLNSMIPLWKKNKNDVSEEELNSFYKSKFSDYEDPLFSLNINVDGIISYNSLVFIPSHAPYNLYSENYEKGLDLYSKGVFVKEKCKELIPDYLKFVKGLVDSNDFDLNISREILQNSPLLRRISDNIENKVISKLKEVKKDDFDKYKKFYEIYGNHIKFGIYSTFGSKKELLQDLLIYKSLIKQDEYISLKEYKENMKENQKYIYFVSGNSLDSIKLLPQLEKYKKEEINVLFLTEEIDEFSLMMLREYEKIEFKNITNENLDNLTDEEKNKIEDLSITHKRILDDLTSSLKGRVDKVVFSSKLIESPVCITTKDNFSLKMEETLKNNNLNKEDTPKASKILEINPDHKLFKAISNLKDEEEISKFASLLYDEAMLLEGFDIEDKTNFVKNLNDLMLKKLD
ncbi:MAG: molecular chaperone HtpG [Bacillales bacterium]